MKSQWPSFLFPVVAFSQAGWSKTASELGDLTDASPDHPLDDWQQLEIYDCSGQRYRARRAFRAWPESRFGHWLCRLVGNCIHVGFEFDAPEPEAFEELRQRLGNAGELSADCDATTHRELLLRTL